MDEQARTALQGLRAAAQADQWNACLERLAELLPGVPAADAVQIVVRWAQRFLTDFAPFHPHDEDLPRASDLPLEALDQVGKVLDAIMHRYWDWPGVSNFRNAFKGISRPQQYFEHAGEFGDSIVSMVASITMATILNDYWGENSEYYTKTFYGEDHRAAIFMQGRADSDPKQVALRAALWTQLADDLEKLLLRS
ncbi:MAG: hypothetical protein IPK17_18680 [Chloroflexi bacterium]|uniref:hypothetical protein n=1 Tax=Candidatus Flexifilum breve TaxID=3140694 RepID=UPI00313580BB|nr:hypothetical protein [Chloroflexota bacterium]